MPLSLVNIPQKSEICILELGMNSYGEIKKLAKIAKPHIAIITNIGNAHIGNFSNALEIAREKSDIFRYFNKNSDYITRRFNLHKFNKEKGSTKNKQNFYIWRE